MNTIREGAESSGSSATPLKPDKSKKLLGYMTNCFGK